MKRWREGGTRRTIGAQIESSNREIQSPEEEKPLAKFLLRPFPFDVPRILSLLLLLLPFRGSPVEVSSHSDPVISDQEEEEKFKDSEQKRSFRFLALQMTFACRKLASPPPPPPLECLVLSVSGAEDLTDQQTVARNMKGSDFSESLVRLFRSQFQFQAKSQRESKSLTFPCSLSKSTSRSGW